VGSTRTLLVAVLALLAAPASALADPCLGLTTGGATDVTSSSATISGTVDPRGQLPTYRFDVGPTLNYGTSTPTRSSTISTPATVTEKLAGLTPGTTYHYRVVASTACGPAETGLDATFSTPLAPGQQPMPVVPLVFTSWLTGNAEVAIAGSDGSGPRLLAPSPASDFDPALSPDGARVVFTSMRSGNGDLYVVNQDGTGLVQVTNTRDADTTPAWSPDGRQIVFASSSPTGPGLFVVNADGTGRHRITTEKAGASDPAWSPNGATIAFVRTVKGTAPEIYTVPATGGAATRITKNTVPDVSPTWSPDGTHLAFTRFTNAGGSSIIVAAANGTGETTVTAASDFARNPVYTRDGARIAYVGLGGGRPSLTVVVLGGGPTLRLLPLTPAPLV
jgi:dipeptidyl aminopeptidase/acylaminoacyl peptidase